MSFFFDGTPSKDKETNHTLHIFSTRGLHHSFGRDVTLYTWRHRISISVTLGSNNVSLKQPWRPINAF